MFIPFFFFLVSLLTRVLPALVCCNYSSSCVAARWLTAGCDRTSLQPNCQELHSWEFNTSFLLVLFFTPSKSCDSLFSFSQLPFFILSQNSNFHFSLLCDEMVAHQPSRAHAPGSFCSLLALSLSPSAPGCHLPACFSFFVPPAPLLPVDMVSRENTLFPVLVAKQLILNQNASSVGTWIAHWRNVACEGTVQTPMESFPLWLHCAVLIYVFFVILLECDVCLGRFSGWCDRTSSRTVQSKV